MSSSKLVGLAEAIDGCVRDGDAVALGTAQESLIPFAAGHEIIRQKKRRLTLIGPISDMLFDQLIGAGCVRKIRAAWIGNVITGSGYNFRRAMEEGLLEIEDHSILTLTSALTAAKLGIPFLPAKTALGSDLYKTNAALLAFTCPYTGERLTAVRAIRPDVTIIHAQRTDRFGNAHVWGNLGVTREACLAARKIIVTAEDIVEPDVISSDPNRVVTPGFLVEAVVHSPWGGHPSPVPGYYNRDHAAFIEYRNSSKTPESFDDWRRRWIDAVKGSDAYRALVGKARLEKLLLTQHVLSEPADFGY
jgi:glutaconate CoA-transferase subunit A